MLVGRVNRKAPIGKHTLGLSAKIRSITTHTKSSEPTFCMTNEGLKRQEEKSIQSPNYFFSERNGVRIDIFPCRYDIWQEYSFQFFNGYQKHQARTLSKLFSVFSKIKIQQDFLILTFSSGLTPLKNINFMKKIVSLFIC